MQFIIAIAAGVLFGAGLAISGMINPAKILNFLDFASIGSGTWDATLGLVFMIAVAMMYGAYEIQRQSASPVYGDRYFVPTNNQIDNRLIIGAVVFGLGWGLIGLCPGPAIAGLVFGKIESVVFLVAMLGGVLIHSMTKRLGA